MPTCQQQTHNACLSSPVWLLHRDSEGDVSWCVDAAAADTVICMVRHAVRTAHRTSEVETAVPVDMRAIRHRTPQMRNNVL